MEKEDKNMGKLIDRKEYISPAGLEAIIERYAQGLGNGTRCSPSDNIIGFECPAELK